jgi:hypothetical protein
MSRFRYPGIIQPAEFCYKKPPQPIEVIAVQQKPYMAHDPCKPVIMDRAIVRIKMCNNRQVVMFETFGGLLLMPINFGAFVGYNFKGGEIVAIEAQYMSNIFSYKKSCQCSSAHSTCDPSYITTCDPSYTTTCEPSYTTTCDPSYTTDSPPQNEMDATPVKLLHIAKTWNKLIRHFNGVVTKEVDKNGITYYMLTETTNLTASDPYFRDVNNKLLFRTIKVRYDIVNVLGVSDVASILESFVGHNISGVYVDYGKETRYREGLPIVIIDYVIN